MKLIFAAPVGLFCGGTLFALLSFGGALGAAITCAIACFAAVGTGAGVCSLVDSSARAMFLREKSPGLPAARLLPHGPRPDRSPARPPRSKDARLLTAEGRP